MPTRPKTFDSHYPVTGDAVGTFPIHTDADVRVAVAQARIASDKWVALGFSGRKKVLLAWSKLLMERVDECTALISMETGKPVSDAKLEASLAAGHLAWAARHAQQVMRTSHRSPGAVMANMSATVERSPLGVVVLLVLGITQSLLQWDLLHTPLLQEIPLYLNQVNTHQVLVCGLLVHLQKLHHFQIYFSA